MRILFVATLLIFIGFTLAQFPIGNNVFYATIINTNGAYGSGAAYPSDVWFNGNLGLMRIDYRNPVNTTVVFMTVYYNYTSHDKYQVCGTSKCQRATWNAPMPIFAGSISTYANPTACITPDWPGTRACVSGCRTYVAAPAQPQGISSLSYNETSGAGISLCLVRWTVQAGQTFAPEWHIQNYYTTGFPSGVTSPGSAAPFTIPPSILSTCPSPSCFSVLDVAIVVDESKSISMANAWPDVQKFVAGLIGTFTMAPDRVRAGLVYFSGVLDDGCNSNMTAASYPSLLTGVSGCGKSYSCNGFNCCPNCGGLWQFETYPGLVTDGKKLYDRSYAHNIYGGATCISCGLGAGIQLLNYAPRANVQKLIIFFTDGAQNRVVDALTTQAAIAKANNIDVITVATASYSLSDLKVFTDPKKIYTSTSFSGLSNLINQITAPLCTALGNIDTCDFCTGLCSCLTTCNCPNCNDFNECTEDKCDPRSQANGGTQGKCLYTAVTCSDGDKCTQDLCNPNKVGGCDYSTPTAVPTGSPADTYCRRNTCFKDSGYNYTDVGATNCGNGDSCIVKYCNTTKGQTNGLIGSCVTVNMNTDVAYNQPYVYTDSGYPTANTFTVYGCVKPLNAAPCLVYKCNPTISGKNCQIDSTACKCLVDTDCNDLNGCTIDTCDTVNNKCVNTPKDCWAEISTNGCKSIAPQTTAAATNATGYAYWSGSATFPLNGNLPVTGNYNCDQLACYGGKQSQYKCFSTGNYSYQCQRQTTECPSSGCTDSICRSSGTWTNGNYDTTCLNIVRSCDDGNYCTTDTCKTSPAFSSLTSCTQTSCPMNNNRCTITNITSSCFDGLACTVDRCLPAKVGGCDFTQALPIPPSTTCFTYTCNNVTGIVKTVKTNACPSTGGDKCKVTYCNTATDSCANEWDKATHTSAESTTFTDEFGATQTIYGCLNTVPFPQPCMVARCNTTTGSCYVDVTACTVCQTALDCDDKDPCTDDACSGGTKCTYTPKDCWQQFSNGGCTLQTPPGSLDNTVGIANYNKGSPDESLPTTSVSCAQLACLGGKRNQFVCTNNAGNALCKRVVQNCTKGGCQDNVCRYLGTFGIQTPNQFDTDCGQTFTPTCNSNGCFASSCDTAFSYVYAPLNGNNGNTPNTGDNRCSVVNNGTTGCIDDSLCTVNQCFNTTGCDYNTIIPNPYQTNFCFNTACDKNSGWTQTNAGPTKCTGSNLCQINYCNTTNGGCSQINRSTIPLGQTVYYTDSDGLTKFATGCANPVSNDPFTCKQYGCDSNTGLCTLDVQNCNCTSDVTCQDGTGCTMDTCVPPGVCQRTFVDCFSYYSNGKCTSTSSISYDNTTGLTLYNNVYLTNGNGANYAAFTTLDTNGNPSPAQGVDRTCAQLSCYNGSPSNYTCSSQGEGSFTCQRTSTTCGRNGCLDNICQSLGTRDSLGQMVSNCGVEIRPKCADENACTSDFCDVAWTPSSQTPRCRHDTVNGTSFCDDGNFCTEDYCDQKDTSGNVCKHRVYADWYVRKYLCKKAKVCQSVQCNVNSCIYTSIGCVVGDLCTFFVCNKSTNGTCKPFKTGVYKYDGCNVCGGNGLSCIPATPGSPKKTSIAVALGVGLGVGLFFALLIIGIITRTSYAAYLALGTETLGTVTTSPTYQGAEHHLDTNDYHRGSK